MKHLTKTFTRQLDQTDCGVACLLSILRYHGGDASRERLRELSGTSIGGTSLLGLYQTAQTLGFAAEGLEAEGVHNLSELTNPAILHVLINDNLQHYVVYYGQENGQYIIGDPGRGVVQINAEELAQIWQSRALLSLKPTEGFVRAAQNRQSQWQWFRALVHDDLPLLGIAAGLGVLMAALGLSMALFSQKLLDEILPKQNVEKLTLGLLLLAVLLLARAGIGYLRGFLVLRQSRDFNTRIADHFFRDLLRLPKSFFDTRKTGDLVARLNDTRRIQATISYLTGSVVIDLLVVLITSGFLFAYHWQIGLLSLVCLPLFGWLVWRFNARIVAGQQESMAGYARAESHFIDCMNGIGVIKANQKEPFFSTITSTIYGTFQQKLYQLGLLANRYSVLSELIGVGMLVGLIALTTFMVLQKQLKLGEMMAVLNMAGTLISSVARLATTHIQLQEARVAFGRMREFTELPAEASVSKTEPANEDVPTGLVLESLKAQGLSYRFVGRPALLKDISFKVQKGQIMGLIGETGSGKSMLLQILQKFYEPEQENQLAVTFAHTGILAWPTISAAEWRGLVACVPQPIKIFNGTLIDNICLGDSTADTVVQFCQEYGFHDYFMKLPQNYLTLVGEEGVNLSGGQQQLVGLARALFRRPQLLLLDEATSALDRQTEQFVLNLLSRIKSEMAIIMVTHRSQSVGIADQVYIMENGVLHLAETVAQE